MWSIGAVRSNAPSAIHFIYQVLHGYGLGPSCIPAKAARKGLCDLLVRVRFHAQRKDAKRGG